METYGNFYLNLDQMTGNAQIILDTLSGFNWTKESICGILGNMQTESTINPGIYESLNSGSTTNGFGLVQWTPNTKYIVDYAQNILGLTSYDQWGRIGPQCARLYYELENGIQWISTNTYPMSFQEFVVSTESPEYLAQVFIRNYERPADPDQPIRSTQARYWYDNLEGGGGSGSGFEFFYKIGRVGVTYGKSKTVHYRTGSKSWR